MALATREAAWKRKKKELKVGKRGGGKGREGGREEGREGGRDGRVRKRATAEDR